MKNIVTGAMLALDAFVAALAAPIAQAEAQMPGNWPLCGAFSLFSKG